MWAQRLQFRFEAMPRNFSPRLNALFQYLFSTIIVPQILKVVRESTGSNASSVKPIEIPPPRPKRKPMHPYPRKLVHSLQKGISVPEQPERSRSPNLSTSEANQSPKSVLSTVVSDTIGSVASNPHNDSPSPVSSAADANPGSLVLAEQENGNLPSTSSVEEDSGYPSSVPVTATSSPQDQSSTKVDWGSKDNACDKEGATSEASMISLKLFGRTVLVTDSNRPSSSNLGSRKSPPSESCKDSDKNDEKPGKTPQQNSTQINFSMEASRSAWSPWPCGAPPMFYCMPFQKEDPNLVEATSSTLPWWALYGGLPYPVMPSFNLNSIQTYPDTCLEETSKKDINREESRTGSNTSSTNDAGVGEKNEDVVDFQNQEPSSEDVEKEPASVFLLKPSETSAFSVLKPIPNKCTKGFVPYKRCLTERDAQSSGIIGEERETQRIRLCL
uniref:Protein REVEILLE 1-like n=1 Tax=Nelumbo nucifera TaxID=4432 RepID=A0A822YE63_NELNU|nr:TPA_asm: hypothetical protein HUJ06_011315 [Nelumbo nucifera]